MVSRCVYRVVGVLCLLALPSFSQQLAPAECPLNLSAAKYVGRNFADIYGTGPRVAAGTLTFHYKNVSGREISSFAVQATSEMQVVGPTRPAMVSTGVDITVPGSLAAGKSKRKRVKVTLSSSTTRVWLWLKHVTFADGQNWDNTDPSQCVFMPRSKGVLVRSGPV